MAKEVVSVLFKNASNEEFVCSWDSVPYRFAPGKEMYVEDWKAQHFAKHWVDRELNRKGLMTNNKVLRDAELVKCLPVEAPITVEEAFDLNAKDKIAETKVAAINHRVYRSSRTVDFESGFCLGGPALSLENDGLDLTISRKDGREPARKTGGSAAGFGPLSSSFLVIN